MAKVEIYKVKETADPEIKGHGMYEFFGEGGPFPKNYVREWAGELPSGDLEMLFGKISLNPPKGYHGGPPEKSDIAVVDGEAYFLDHGSDRSYEFSAVDFDTSAIKDAIHVDYGRYVSVDEAAVIPHELVIICKDLDIPTGYVGEPGHHGSSKGISDFEQLSTGDYATCYLHPQFLQGEDARAFVALLTELSKTGRWTEIAGYLLANYPVYMSDLETARERFAPELLLPAELRPIAKAIPIDADKTETDYLTAKVTGMDSDRRNILYAVVEAGWHHGSVAEIINLTENLDCFKLRPEYDNTTSYGKNKLSRDWDECEATVNRLEKSEDPAERTLYKHIMLLERCVDEEAYGYNAAKEENGAFTRYGLVTHERVIEEIYRGVQDIPPAAPVAPERDAEPVMVRDVDLAAPLLEMHAVGGDYMRDASYNVKALVNKGEDFFVMTNAGMLIVTPADLVFRRDTREHEMWMLQSKAPDIRAFVMSVTERDGERIVGNLFGADLYDLQDYVRENSFFFTHLDAKMKDGSSRRFTLPEWDAMDQYERGQLKSWVKHYDPADEAKLVTCFGILRRVAPENRRPIAAGEFLSQINEQFMAQAGNHRSDMLRVAPEAAKEILAQSAADVFRLMPNGMEKLSPIDAIKVTVYREYREFAVRRSDWDGIEKWARRGAGNILRQNERGERDKPKMKNPEL
jgi:hypothetical protein